MADPVLTKALTRLRGDFNARFPTRDKGTDGWIGDEAHQEHVSGHNPDDTEGSKSEYTDADTKAEVRAIDVDKDLRDAVVSMQAVINLILKTTNDLKRLKYIIFNRQIWSKSNNWVVREYTGTNGHTEHAHFSGDPAYDEDASAWSVLTIGGTMALTQADVDLILRSDAVPWVAGHQYTVGGAINDTAQRVITIRELVTEINATVKVHSEALSKLTSDVAELKTLMAAMMAMLENQTPAPITGTVFVSGELTVSPPPEAPST